VGWATKPTTPAEQDAALNATTPGQKRTTPGLQSPIRLQTDYGVITDIIQSAEHGTIVLLEVETNGVATLQSEHASKFPRNVITKAMRSTTCRHRSAKHLTPSRPTKQTPAHKRTPTSNSKATMRLLARTQSPAKSSRTR
jgi:hypothetical protein